MANENKISHSPTIMRSWKQTHSHNMGVANEHISSHSHTIVCSRKRKHLCDTVSANEQKNPHSHTTLDLSQNLHAPIENQNMTIVHITLIGVPIMLRGQIKQQVINQVGVSNHLNMRKVHKIRIRQETLIPIWLPAPLL